ncbi:MAG: uroporphyrinogen decarboxylase family protein [Anaerofustis sp.]
MDSYNERLDRVYTTLYHKEPDIVPLFIGFGTYAIGYADARVEEMEADWKKEVEIYLKPHERLYADAVYTAGLVFDSTFARCIGSPAHFISEDGQTVQHHEQSPMQEDEYDQLIADPEKFIFNVCLPRTAKKLAGTTAEKKESILSFMQHLGDKTMAWNTITERLKSEYNRPVLASGAFAYPPMDILFDYLRGFKGIATDMRRQPEKLLAGIEALEDFAWKFMGINDDTKSLPEFPPFATMFHVPTFLSPKQFETFFMPSYERMTNRINELGGKLIMFLEGKWDNKYDYLSNMSKNFAFGIVEGDDIFEAKKRIGDTICLIGGMPLQTLKYGTPEQCKDYAKRVVDECAPGGGFLFGTSRELLSKGDLNYENLVETYDFVHNYGKYR